MSTRATSSSDSLLDELPLASGAQYGAAAWVVGLVIVTLLLNVIESDNGFKGDWIKFSGQVFYNAHYVDLATNGGSVNYLHGDIGSFIDWTIPAIGYTILVVAIIAVAAYMLTSGLSISDGTEGAKAGATVLVGYLPLTLVGSFLFKSNGASPELLTSFLLMGIVIPAVVGAAAGYAAAEA